MSRRPTLAELAALDELLAAERRAHELAHGRDADAWLAAEAEADRAWDRLAAASPRGHATRVEWRVDP